MVAVWKKQQRLLPDLEGLIQTFEVSKTSKVSMKGIKIKTFAVWKTAKVISLIQLALKNKSFEIF